MTLKGALALKKLNKKDLRLLLAIEIGMRHSQYVDLETISKYSHLSQSELNPKLQKCHGLDLLHRWVGHFTGFELTIHGYDCLALNTLYEQNKIKSLGREKGVGKESKVFFALNENDEEVIIKLHRVGYTSFHQVKKKRKYIGNRTHLSELYASRLSAESEIKWLKNANSFNLPVPKYYGGNRHIVIEELIQGIELSKLKKLTNPTEVLKKILDFIDTAWNEANFVHGDLSEHNIIINYNEEPIIFDFPQSVSKNSQEAIVLLKRDITNVLNFFKRKYNIGISLDEVLYQIIN